MFSASFFSTYWSFFKRIDKAAKNSELTTYELIGAIWVPLFTIGKYESTKKTKSISVKWEKIVSYNAGMEKVHLYFNYQLKKEKKKKGCMRKQKDGVVNQVEKFLEVQIMLPSVVLRL